MKVISEGSLKFFKSYIETPSPSGYERAAQSLWLEHMKSFTDDIHLDHYNNAIAVLNPKAKFKIMLEAHGDEISWLVNYIDQKGFLHVLPNGGADPQVCPGKRAHIHTRKGMIPCVFGWPAIHLRNYIRDLYIDDSHLFVDCGCSSREEAEKIGIRVGDVITFRDGLEMMNDRFLVGRGLDNRIGSLIIAEVARHFSQARGDLPYALYFVNAVQEEVGLKGAKMAADQIQPDVAIVTDVTHDTSTPFIDERKNGDTRCGWGPVVAIAPAIHKELLQLTEDVAKDKDIPIQRVAISRETGTDADAIALARGGVCSILISPPLRYMHTPVEMVCWNDVEATIQLMCGMIRRLTPDLINKRHAFVGNELG